MLSQTVDAVVAFRDLRRRLARTSEEFSGCAVGKISMLSM